MSGVSSPMPEQNNLNPPPVPVDSIIGVLNFPPWPNCSAAAEAKGYTVDEPTARIWSRAMAGVVIKAVVDNITDAAIR